MYNALRHDVTPVNFHLRRFGPEHPFFFTASLHNLSVPELSWSADLHPYWISFLFWFPAMWHSNHDMSLCYAVLFLWTRKWKSIPRVFFFFCFFALELFETILITNVEEKKPKMHKHGTTYLSIRNLFIFPLFPNWLTVIETHVTRRIFQTVSHLAGQPLKRCLLSMDTKIINIQITELCTEWVNQAYV